MRFAKASARTSSSPVAWRKTRRRSTPAGWTSTPLRWVVGLPSRGVTSREKVSAPVGVKSMRTPSSVAVTPVSSGPSAVRYEYVSVSRLQRKSNRMAFAPRRSKPTKPTPAKGWSSSRESV
jgi:hypothetical protein